MSYLHGVEVVEVFNGSRPITTQKTGIIFLAGIAPTGAINEMKVISSLKQGLATYGQQLTGFTIPQALDQIFAQGGGPVIVVNVFDPEEMTAAVSAEVKTVTNGRFKLAYAPIGAVVVTNSGGSTTYVNGTDYSVDAFGNVTVLATITEGQSLRASYDRLDLTAIAASDIIGTVSGNTYSGLQLLDTALATFGFVPKIIIAPTFCELDSVATEMIEKADALKALTFIDAPSGSDDVGDVISERGLAGTFAGFRTSSKNVNLLYPYYKRYDVATDSTVITPPSPYWAGIVSASDNSRGFWFSPSNVEIKGITGVEFNLSANISDPNADVNLLNGAGINTVFVAYGTGFRTWGNRNASFPTNTLPDNFTAVQRVKTILEDAVVAAMLQFLDLPINRALIDSIRESVNTYIRSLVQRGALIDGECLYDPDDNPAEQVSAGQLVFQVNYLPPSAAERITFNTFLDISLLQVLNQQ
jgi:phage tail sheath protein FI